LTTQTTIQKSKRKTKTTNRTDRSRTNEKERSETPPLQIRTTHTAEHPTAETTYHRVTTVGAPSESPPVKSAETESEEEESMRGSKIGKLRF
jgi:hypothetical protein